MGHVPKVVQASYRRNRDAFVERFGALIGDAMVAKMDEVQERLPELCSQLERDPWTLCHGDYRLDNLMFRSDGRTTVLDWQGLAWGRPGWEVAYFITTALEPNHRDEEQMMLARYHDTLVAAGFYAQTTLSRPKLKDYSRKVLHECIHGNGAHLDDFKTYDELTLFVKLAYVPFYTTEIK